MPEKKRRKPLLHSTELSEHTILKGDLKITDTLMIKGHFSGTINSNSHVTIDRGAIVDTAAITARSLSISGSTSGSVQAQDYIEITDTSIVSADLVAPEIKIAESSRFEGRIRMLSNHD